MAFWELYLQILWWFILYGYCYPNLTVVWVTLRVSDLGNSDSGMFAMSGFVMLLALDRTIIIFGTKKCKELRKNNVAMGLSITVWVSLG